MKKYDIEPRNYKEHIFVNHSRQLGESEEDISRRLRDYRRTCLIVNIIAGVSLIGVFVLYAFILYQLLFVG